MSVASDWYLIYTKPKQERVAEDNLQRQGYRAYLPLMHVLRRRQGHYQNILEPMFPRYLFVQLSTTTDNWGPIRSTRGVAALVRFGGEPAKVPSSFVELLQRQEDQPTEPELPVFQQGDRVRVLEGVLSGYEGIFEAKSGAKRVTLLLEMVDNTMKIELPVDAVGLAG